MNKLCTFVLIVLFVNVSMGATWTVNPGKDAGADAGNPYNNIGTSPLTDIGWMSGYQYWGHWAAFDMPTDLAGATVTSAILTVVPRYTVGDLTVNINVMTHDWVEGTGGTGAGADYFTYDGTSPWTGTYSLGLMDRVLDSENHPVVFSSVVFPNAPYPGHENGTAPVTINLTSVVQYWADGNPNYGIFFQVPDAGGTKYTDLFTREAAENLRPVLTITYIPTSIKHYQVEADKDASGKSDQWGNLGRYAFHEGSVNNGSLYAPLGWAKYNLPNDLAGARVISATIEYDVFGVEDDSMGFYVYGMTTDWVEGNNSANSGACYMSPDGVNAWPNGNGWGTADIMAGIRSDSGILVPRANDYSNYDTYNVDITDIAQAWANGSANHGVLMVPYDDGSGWNWIQIGMDTADQGGGGYIPHGTILHLEYDVSQHNIEIAANKDTLVNAGDERNYGAYPFIELWAVQTYRHQSGFVKWDIPSALDGKTVVDAKIHFFARNCWNQIEGQHNPLKFQIHAMTSPWEEGTGNSEYSDDGATWTTYNGWDFWQHWVPGSPANADETLGGGGYLELEFGADELPVIYGEANIPEFIHDPYDLGFEFDVNIAPTLIQKWISGEMVNNGIRLSSVIENTSVVLDIWSRNADSYSPTPGTWAPRLIINYAEPDCNDWVHRLDGDIDGDCYVDFKDVHIFADEWLATGDVISDIDDSDNVDFADFSELANDWMQNSLLP